MKCFWIKNSCRATEYSQEKRPRLRASIFILHAACLLLCLVFFADGAWAADSSGLLDDIVQRFRGAASSWGDTILNYAETLFWGFGVISLVYTSGMLLLDGADIQKNFAHFIRFIMFFGFFLFLLKNGPAIAKTILNSMMQIGNSVTKN